MRILLRYQCTHLASATGIELDVSHIQGTANVIADDLSRGSFKSPVPHDFDAKDRISLSPPQVGNCLPRPTFHPPESKLLWELPQTPT